MRERTPNPLRGGGHPDQQLPGSQQVRWFKLFTIFKMQDSKILQSA